MVHNHPTHTFHPTMGAASTYAAGENRYPPPSPVSNTLLQNLHFTHNHIPAPTIHTHLTHGSGITLLNYSFHSIPMNLSSSARLWHIMTMHFLTTKVKVAKNYD